MSAVRPWKKGAKASARWIFSTGRCWSPCPPCPTSASPGRSSTCAPIPPRGDGHRHQPEGAQGHVFGTAGATRRHSGRRAIRLKPGGGRADPRGGPMEAERGFVLHSSGFQRRRADRIDRQIGEPDRDARHPARHRPRRRAQLGRRWRWAMRAGVRASSKTRSRTTAG